MKQKQVKGAPKNAKQAYVKKAVTPKKVAAAAAEESNEEEEIVVPKKTVKNPFGKVQKKVVEKVNETSEDESEEEQPVVEKNGVKNPFGKVQKKVVEEVNETSEDESEEEQAVVEKNGVKNPFGKVQKKVVEASEEDDDDEEVEQNSDDEEVEEDGDDQDEEEEIEDDSDEQEQDDDDEQDNEDDDEEDDEDDEQDEDEQEEEKEEDDDNEEPTIPSKVKFGPISPNCPMNKVVNVKNLPRNTSRIDVVHAFAKYGSIYQIHLVNTPPCMVCQVSFNTVKGAQAALAAHKTVYVNGNLIEVTPKTPRKEGKADSNKQYDLDECHDRCVFVKNFSRRTTEYDIRNHFESCGEIERCVLDFRHIFSFCYLTFVNKESVAAAKKLHNSILKDRFIGVFEYTADVMTTSVERDPKLTISVKNTQNLQTVDVKTLETIFEKCGEIDQMDVLCTTAVIAFITFKNEESVEKAFELNGKTEEGINLEIQKYFSQRTPTSIFVSNLSNECTEEDLTTLFSKFGKIKAITLKTTFAIIQFEDVEAYCKSFMANESYIKSRMIFLEPYSRYKTTLMKFKNSQKFKAKSSYMFNNNKAHKRYAPNGSSVFKGKPAKRPRMA